MNRIWSLRFLIPIGVLVVFTTVLLVSILNSVNQREESITQGVLDRAKHNIAQLTRHAERFIQSDPQALNEDISQLATDPQLETIAIFNPDKTIYLSNHLHMRNKQATSLLSKEDLANLDQALKTRFAIINESTTNDQITLMMSFLTPSNHESVRGLERGVIYMVYDVSIAHQLAKEVTFREHILELILLTLCALSLVWILHIYVTRPLSQMRDTAEAISQGKFEHLSGNNGLAEIQGLRTAFNSMSTQLSQHVTQLSDQIDHTQAIVDNLVDGIITINDDGIIRTFNPASVTIFGYTPEEVIGKNIKLLMPDHYRNAHDGYLQNYAQTRIKRIIGIGREVEGLRKNGERFPLELAVSSTTNQGKPVYVGIIRDITERKRIEQMKSEFVSTVSHELRTPLTSISGALKLITSGALGTPPEQVQQMIAIAYRNSQQLTFLINDLLDMEKLLAGKMHFEIELQPLAPLIEQAIEANRAYGYKRSVELVLTSELTKVDIHADSQRLMQVLSNLLSNAIKYAPTGSNVEIFTEKHPHAVRVTVRDHGCGIPIEFHSRIFQKFAQADSSDSRQKGGTGLGLAISKELIERMGGQISFNSIEGQGASFYFDLPC